MCCFGGGRAAPYLVAFFSDADDSVRHLAAETLGAAGGRVAACAAAGALDNEVPAVRAAALYALGKLRADGCVDQEPCMETDTLDILARRKCSSFGVVKGIRSPCCARCLVWLMFQDARFTHGTIRRRSSSRQQF